MDLETIEHSIVELTRGLGIVWQSNVAIIPIENDDGTPTGEAVERRTINGHLVVSNIGFYMTIPVPDAELEMEPEAWANVICAQLANGMLDLSVYMNNSAVEIKNKSRELAKWEVSHFDIGRNFTKDGPTGIDLPEL